MRRLRFLPMLVFCLIFLAAGAAAAERIPFGETARSEFVRPQEEDTFSSQLRLRVCIPDSCSPSDPTVVASAVFLGLPDGFCEPATLIWYRNGIPYRTEKNVPLQNGLRSDCPVSFVFSEKMPDAAEISLQVSCGVWETERCGTVALQNFGAEHYERLKKEWLPYRVQILRNQNVALVYARDEDGQYSILQNAFLCSTGRATPYGTYYTSEKKVWGQLFGSKSSNYQYVYGQYVTRIVNNILFHTVPYFTMVKDDLEYEQYDLLGTAASLGCIRMNVESTKWIYDNCPYGTRIEICDLDTLPVTRPASPVIDPEDPRRGWDPTDPDPDNPWIPEKILSGAERMGKGRTKLG